jgi:hypothetical protein
LALTPIAAQENIYIRSRVMWKLVIDLVCGRQQRGATTGSHTMHSPQVSGPVSSGTAQPRQRKAGGNITNSTLLVLQADTFYFSPLQGWSPATPDSPRWRLPLPTRALPFSRLAERCACGRDRNGIAQVRLMPSAIHPPTPRYCVHLAKTHANARLEEKEC